MSMDLVFSWLLTYWVHSAIALTGMWLASALWRERNLALEESAWKAAMFLTVVTATVQVGLTSATEFRPLTGALEWVRVREADPIGSWTAPAAHDSGSQTATIASVEGADSFARAARRSLSSGESGAVPVVEQKLVEDTSSAEVSTGLDVLRGVSLPILMVSLWLLVMSAVVVKLLVSYLVFAKRLASRKSVLEGPFVALLARLKERGGVLRQVGLSLCGRISVPLALGFRRWEICLPTRLTEEFDPEEQETVLAHELAHLVRRDTFWLLTARALAGALCFQPLNFLALARLTAVSELRCDDWAVAQTGRPVTLARCLTRVATWRSDRWAGSPVPAMAGTSRSHFGTRVRRLLSRGYPLPPASVPGWVKGAMAPLVVLFVAAAPGIVQGTQSDAVPEVVTVAPVPPVAPAKPVAPAPEMVSLTEAPAVSAHPAAAPRVDLPPAVVRTPAVEALPAAKALPAPVPVSVAHPRVAPNPAPRPMSHQAPTPSVGRVGPAAVPLASARYALMTAGGAFVGVGELAAPAAGAADRAPRPARSLLAASERHHDADDSDEHDSELEALEEALDEEIEALQEAFDDQMEAMSEELEAQLETLEDRIEESSESTFESFEEGLESDLERAFEDLERFAEDMAVRSQNGSFDVSRRHLERKIERSEAELDRFHAERERRLEAIARDRERSVERILTKDFEREIDRAVEVQQSNVERRIERAARDLELAARRMASPADDRERARRHRQVAEELRGMMPSDQELAEIRAAFEQVREEMAPRMQTVEAEQAEFERMLSDWRASYRIELERLLEERRRAIESSQ